MNAMRARLVFAALLLMLGAIAKAHAGRPAPVYVDVVITFAGQTSGIVGPLRYFEMTNAGGRVALDLQSIESSTYMPLPDVDVTDLEATGNAWQILARLGHSVFAFTGTCAAESFTTIEAGAIVQHVFLNCSELET
jgi:hypothetical protein